MEYVIDEQDKVTILRIGPPGWVYGEPFLIAMTVSYWGKYRDTVLLEGLDKTLKGDHKRALVEHFRKKGVRFMKWDHRDNHKCLEIETGKLRIE